MLVVVLCKTRFINFPLVVLVDQILSLKLVRISALGKCGGKTAQQLKFVIEVEPNKAINKHFVMQPKPSIFLYSNVGFFPLPSSLKIFFL